MTHAEMVKYREGMLEASFKVLLEQFEEAARDKNSDDMDLWELWEKIDQIVRFQKQLEEA